MMRMSRYSYNACKYICTGFCQIVIAQASLYTILSSGLDYWIGLTDLAYEGVYKWQNQFEEANFTFWNTGQPDNYDAEDCILLVRKSITTIADGR